MSNDQPAPGSGNQAVAGTGPHFAWIWNPATLRVERREVWFGYARLAWVDGFAERVPAERIHETQADAEGEAVAYIDAEIARLQVARTGLTPRLAEG